MCYISLSAVVYERFRRAKQYLKQHYRNIKRDSHLSLHQRIVWNKADLQSVQPALILSVSHTANQESTWRQITNDGLVCFWLPLLLSCAFGFLDSCVHHLVSFAVLQTHTCVSLSAFYVFLISQSLDSWSMCYIYVNVLAKTAYLFLKAHNAVLARFTVPTYSPHFLALRQAMPTAALKYSQN